MRRRAFITLLGGLCRSCRARSSQSECGVLVLVTTIDPIGGGSVESLSRPGTPRDLPPSNTAWAGNGWNCSSRSHQA